LSSSMLLLINDLPRNRYCVTSALHGDRYLLFLFRSRWLHPEPNGIMLWAS